MTENNPQNKVKIRFKFKSGEEFEAEGNPDFIARQRADFLQLIGKEIAPADVPARSISARPAAASASHQTATAPAPEIYTPLGDLSLSSEIWSKKGGISQGISAAEARQQRQSQPRTVGHPADTRLWEQIVRSEDRHVYLRRKSRLLTPASAALLLIAAAKVLLDATEGYSALALSKSLKKSGYGGERVLAAEMRQGTILSDGTKRSRVYLLSNEGFTRAYVLAGKLAAEWQG